MKKASQAEGVITNVIMDMMKLPGLDKLHDWLRDVTIVQSGIVELKAMEIFYGLEKEVPEPSQPSELF